MLSVVGVFLFLIPLAILGMVLSPEFMSGQNIRSIIESGTLLGIVVTGFVFVTFSGHYADLSVPSIMAASGIVCVSALKFGFVPAICIGVGVGLLVGVLNGWAIGYLRVNPIIWTLMSAGLVNGLIRYLYSSTQAYPEDSPAGRAFIELYRGSVLGISNPTFILLLLFISGALILYKTRFGAQLKLMGSQYEVARMTGINVKAITLQVFLLSAFSASICGILLASLSKIGSDAIGGGYDFRAVTAVVVGGVTLSGGQGSIVGALGGVMVLQAVNNILTLKGVDTFQQQIAQGAIFILVVGITSLVQRKGGRSDE